MLLLLQKQNPALQPAGNEKHWARRQSKRDYLLDEGDHLRMQFRGTHEKPMKHMCTSYEHSVAMIMANGDKVELQRCSTQSEHPETVIVHLTNHESAVPRLANGDDRYPLAGVRTPVDEGLHPACYPENSQKFLKILHSPIACDWQVPRSVQIYSQVLF